MKLAYWMYAGPAHIGTLRVASSFKNVHAIMHAPLGDDYFNVMRSMLERERDFTPVTASIVDRHVLARGSQEKVVENITRKDKEERPDLIVLTPTCTSSILQEDLQNFVNRAAMESKSDVILADVNHYRVNELQAADRTLEQIVRFYIEKATHNNKLSLEKTSKPSANIFGIFTLGFHHQHDSRELKRLLADLGIAVNEIIPEGCSVENLKNLPKAWFNIVPYREVGLMAAKYLQKEFSMPYITTTPMGIVDTAIFIREIQNIVGSYFKQKTPPFVAGETFLSIDGGGDGASPPSPSKHGDGGGDGASPPSPLKYGDGGGDGASPPSPLKYGDDGNPFAPPSKPGDNGNPFAPPPKDGDGSPPKDGDGPLSKDGNHPEKQKFNAELTKKSGFDYDFQIDYEKYIDNQTRFVSQAAWFSRSIDCQNLTGKKAVVFGDATHASSITKILAREMGVRVCCAGTYCKHDADWFREQVQNFCDEVLITDDHTQVADMIARIEPSAIFGTQMERHIGKRLDIPCGVISAPVHIQNFPLGYRPFLGYEGANQIADLAYNSFTLGMEDHLLEIFGGHDTKEVITKTLSTQSDLTWSADGLAELAKIPGFVRGKIKRNTEKYAREKGLKQITTEVMFAAKEAVGA